MIGERTLLEVSDFVRDLGIYYAASLFIARAIGSIVDGTKLASKRFWTSSTMAIKRPSGNDVSVASKAKFSLTRTIVVWTAFFVIIYLSLHAFYWARYAEIPLVNFAIGAFLLVCGLFVRRDYLRELDNSRINLDVACFLICLFLLV